MKSGVSYARVSSKEQEQGYSLDSQVRTLSDYATSKGVRIAREFRYAESAKEQGRKHFNAMLNYLRQHPDVRIVLVEKTDRLCRNLKDFVLVESLVEELGLEIHLVKEGQVLRTDSKSQDKLVQGMFALLARNYIQNLQEEILKGQIIKAEKGQYPGRARFGYAHNRELRTIVAHPTNARVVKLMFKLCATGEYTIAALRTALKEQTGATISKSNLQRMLRSRFYLGVFRWRGREYKGIHPPLVDFTTFERVQDIISGRCKPKQSRHNFAFSSLLNCAEDGCTITGLCAKSKYVYYRCSFGRGKHNFPYIPEPKLAEMLGSVLKPIEIPSDVAQSIMASVGEHQAKTELMRQEKITFLNQQLAVLKSRQQKAYRDKLDGFIDEGFWRANMEQWSVEEMQVQEALECTSRAVSRHQVTCVQKVLELAQVAHSMYFTLDHAGRGKLLKITLSNCATDGISLFPSYSKPFDLIAERAKNQEWRSEWDSNPRHTLRICKLQNLGCHLCHFSLLSSPTLHDIALRPFISTNPAIQVSSHLTLRSQI